MIKVIYEKDDSDGYMVEEGNGGWVVLNGAGELSSEHSTKYEAEHEALRTNRINELGDLMAEMIAGKLVYALQEAIWDAAENMYKQLFEKWDKESK